MSGIDGKVVSCLHFDEDFNYDEIKTNVWYSNGSSIVNNFSKFGTGSLIGTMGTKSAAIVTNANFSIHTGDFTIEWWEYKTARGASSSNGAASFYAGKSWGIQVGWENGSQTKANFSAGSNGTSWNLINGVQCITILLNQWVHYAVVRSGANLMLFQNGTIVNNTNIGASTIIGGGPSYTYIIPSNLSGYIDEFRISNIARYTANFTPQTTQFSVDANTISLCHFDKIYQANDEVSGNIWNPIALPKPFGQLYKFNKSLYLDGNSYLALPNDSTKIDLSTGDFTIDWWEYRTVGYSTGIRPTVFCCNDTDGSADDHGLLVGYIDQSSNGNNSVYASSTGNSWNMIVNFSLGSIDLNTWNHFAFVRKGNTFYGFKNGTLISTVNSNLSIYGLGNILLGKRNLNDGLDYFFKGCIDEFRISKIARWTTNFTPPTSPYCRDFEGIKDRLNLLHGYK